MKKKFVIGVFLLVMSLLGPFQGLLKASERAYERTPSSLLDRTDLIEQNQINKAAQKNLKVIKNKEVLKKVFKNIRNNGSLDQLRSFQITFF